MTTVRCAYLHTCDISVASLSRGKRILTGRTSQHTADQQPGQCHPKSKRINRQLPSIKPVSSSIQRVERLWHLPFPPALINKERETQLAISVYCIPYWLVRSPITPCGEVIDPYSPQRPRHGTEPSREPGAHFTQCGQATRTSLMGDDRM